MEEIVGADAIRGEILDDARKKAARILEEAEEESSRTLSATEGKAAAAVGEILSACELSSRRIMMEAMARLPLERNRMRTAFVEESLAEAMARYTEGLGEERQAALAAAMLSRGGSFLAGKAVRLSRKGLSELAAKAVAASALPSAASVEIVLDDSLPANGLIARAVDGSVELRATMDLVEELLLDRYRGELACALCPEATASVSGAAATIPGAAGGPA
jgi:hypothetical protein